ncbi:MAG: enoyl-CoA hydratase/isomerase family protein [Hydrogenophilaceae bacterium]|jgi:enoyl-CoA hydratase|nr:enoyl-CoA hydratase/isomerase family protein [Hydrogenophilaceae bacterium]
MSEVLTKTEAGLAVLTLNRPAALHALTTPMCRAMTDALLAWRDDPAIKIILIDHAEGTRGFCAGGDIRMLAESGAKDGKEAREFFFTEYRLNHLLQSYGKPIVALIDGVTMGGGVGVSVHGPFRVATERTTFAMPETGIGLFPDVGGGWFLPRLEGEVGMWLALTGARLKAPDCLAAGVATHYVPSELLGAVRTQIAGAAAAHDPMAALRSGLDALSESAGPVKELTAANCALIDAHFAHETVEAIVASLASDGSPWANAQLEALRTKSPQTLKVAFRQLRTGATLASFADNMRMEYRIGARVVQRHDFLEGVRAVIVDKDNAPKWDPPTLEGVTDAMLDEIFAPLPAGEEWSPL